MYVRGAKSSKSNNLEILPLSHYLNLSPFRTPFEKSRFAFRTPSLEENTGLADTRELTTPLPSQLQYQSSPETQISYFWPH